MDAVEYLEARDRMCKSYTACSLCPLHEKKEENYSCDVFEVKHPKEYVSIVKQWSKEHPKEHPVVTNAMKFEEVFGYFAPVQGRPYMPSTWWDEPYKEPEGKE